MSKSGKILVVVVGIVLFILGLMIIILDADDVLFSWGSMPQEFLIGIFVAVLGIAFIIVGGVTVIIDRP